MNRFRLRQLETVLGRGPRRELCPDCGGLDFEMVMTAMHVEDGESQKMTLESALQILDEFENQPATCSNCGGETFAETCKRMWEEDPPHALEDTTCPVCRG